MKKEAIEISENLKKTIKDRIENCENKITIADLCRKYEESETDNQ